MVNKYPVILFWPEKKNSVMMLDSFFALRAALEFGFLANVLVLGHNLNLMAGNPARAAMNADQLRQELLNMENAGNALHIRLLDYAGADRAHPIDTMIQHAAGIANLDHRGAIVGLLRAKRARLCLMCAGRGHWADKCPLRKEIDRAFRNTPVMAQWSQVKTIAFQDI